MDPSGQLCYTDAYLQSVEARVIAVDDGGDAPIVVLDRTVFYPGGGGQPSDSGTILRTSDGRSWTIRAAKKAGGYVLVVEGAAKDIPLGEVAEPEDIANVVMFLASGLARHATGTTVHVNGASYVH